MTDEQAAFVRAWEKTVDVQQHFNDLSLRVRSFAVTVATAALGAALIAFRETPTAGPWILLAGALAWLGFWMMDAYWYHQLLLGSVAHGEAIEDRLAGTGLPEFGLAKRIRETSRVRLLGAERRSETRLKFFYRAGLLLFILIGAGAWLKTASAPPPGQLSSVPTLLKGTPELLFPPENATLGFAEPVAFGWALVAGARQYRLEVERDNGEGLVAIAVPRTLGVYVIEPNEAGLEGQLRWRAVPLDALGKPLHPVPWKPFSVARSMQ